MSRGSVKKLPNLDEMRFFFFFFFSSFLKYRLVALVATSGWGSFCMVSTQIKKAAQELSLIKHKGKTLFMGHSIIDRRVIEGGRGEEGGGGSKQEESL